MYEWITITAYPWIKALHVIAVISWMAGMLYLPRLFVYHCEAEIGSKQSETFKVMERRLLKAIINPYPIALGCAVSLQSANIRQEIISRIFGINPEFDGMPVDL